MTAPTTDSGTTVATTETPASPEDVVEESPLVEADLLVEDVSIDGMCGVY
jgi:mycofactocin precursor